MSAGGESSKSPITPAGGIDKLPHAYVPTVTIVMLPKFTSAYGLLGQPETAELKLKGFCARSKSKQGEILEGRNLQVNPVDGEGGICRRVGVQNESSIPIGREATFLHNGPHRDLAVAGNSPCRFWAVGAFQFSPVIEASPEVQNSTTISSSSRHLILILGPMVYPSN